MDGWFSFYTFSFLNRCCFHPALKLVSTTLWPPFFLSFLSSQHFSVLEGYSNLCTPLPIKFMILSRELKSNSSFLSVVKSFLVPTPGLSMTLVCNSLATCSSQKVILMKPLLRKGGSTLLFQFSVSFVLFLAYFKLDYNTSSPILWI